MPSTEVKWSYDEQTVAKPDEHRLASANLNTHRSNRMSEAVLQVLMGVWKSSQRVRRVSYRTHSKKCSYCSKVVLTPKTGPAVMLVLWDDHT